VIFAAAWPRWVSIHRGDYSTSFRGLRLHPSRWCLQTCGALLHGSAGLSANDGPTHHGLFDIAYLRCLPTSSPWRRRTTELQDMISRHSHSTALSATRAVQPKACPSRKPRGTGDRQSRSAEELCQPRRRQNRALPLGNMRMRRRGAESLATEGFDVALINPRFTKPLDAPLQRVLRTRGRGWS